MKELNNYILEKLKIDKDTKLDNFIPNLEEEVINYLTGKLHYKYKEDYTFEIKDPKLKNSNILKKIHIDLLSDNIAQGSDRDLEKFCDFMVIHLNGIFKDKYFTFNCERKFKEIEIYIRNRE